MPKVEKKICIESTPEKIFKIITNRFITPKWNPAVESVFEIDGNKLQLDTDIGGIVVIKSEAVENQHVTWYTENSEMSSIGYTITPKKEDVTKVTFWAEFDNKKQLKLFKEIIDKVLIGLKSYVEYLEEGGDTDLYRKWEVFSTH
ncbi:MAG: hypothetical protein R3255_01635 [Candidatus Lokiarchaeia archaeon]|nr:hypothetical protein [Candidatus Lokiarchaeia archaeon]